MQVTISLLPVSLSLVHIPRSRLNHLSHPILKQILHPNPGFLNITCNQIELSIFAEHHMLQDFEPIARKDSLKRRSRSGSGSSRKSARRASSHSPHEPVEISYDTWSVLQIDSHSDRIGTNPIFIIFCAFSPNFILFFQKDNCGSRVYDLSAPLAAAGISILYQSSYTSDFIFVKESRLQEAMSLFAAAGFHLYSEEANSPSIPSSPILCERSLADFSAYNNGAILTRDISDLRSSNNQLHSFSAAQQSPRSKSHSPTAGEVRMLNPDLACVGLSDEFGVDHWGLKIVKLVAFPELIPSTPCSSNFTSRKNSTQTDVSSPLTPAVVDLSVSELFSSHSAESSDTASSSSSDDDGYFSHSPQNVSTTSLNTNMSRSYSDLHSLKYPPSLCMSPSKHYAKLAPLSPIASKSQPHLSLQVDSSHSMHSNTSKNESHVPFFSFTRTPEGSSLTADVHMLATLFPPHERHMVICSGELDAADLRLAGMDSSDDEDEIYDASERSSSLKCLQIDLRRFGLGMYPLHENFSV
ncbi:hypothetical protein CVT24_011472 [Panaeolus cyanescens]|uniref:CASTOR ACT domain-containing protein n=1 Tax=Panaeolus cyanescens TaxID=181874 RepID=A0A409VGG7_9AGAR|nr:hypothetical protein CVT24_011472 [Panaeolus cyanescens]